MTITPLPNTPLFELNRPLSEDDVKAYGDELENLQGNILKSHGRGAAVHMFLTFKDGEAAAARKFLREFAGEITSAAEQRRQTGRFRDTHKLETFLSLSLSAEGYKYLGLSIDDFKPEFRGGMRNADLDDPPIKKWEGKFQKTIHALLILADDRVEELTQLLSEKRDALKGFAEVSVEFGLTMRNEDKQAIEHFGYADGVSQPLFFTKDIERQPSGDWDPSAGLDLVLVHDPHGSDRACGTYFVFRKLEQNVQKFKKTEERLADEFGLKNRELAGAMIIGRFEDGTPLALSGVEQHCKEPANDFKYTRDPEGNRCPLSAHVRILNPRLSQERDHRIVRRGITYGDPTPPGEDSDSLPQSGVGLLFQCCQADLADQFEFQQRSLANNRSGTRYVGRDPVIGQSSDNKFPALQLPADYNESERKTFPDFHSVVTMKGGEYFFVPSISFLKRL